MLKNVRNAFGEVNPLFDENVGEINFSHIKELDKLQRDLKLHLGNKLSKYS